MSQENTPVPGESGAKPGEATPQEQPTVDELKNSVAAARRREKETQDKLDAVTKRLTDYEAQQAAAETKSLEEQSKFKELYEKAQQELEDLKPFQEKWTAHETAENAKIDAVREKLTGEQQTVLDALPGLNEKRMYLDTLKTEAPKPGLPGHKGVKNAGDADFISKEVFEANKHDARWRRANLDKINKSVSEWQ